MDNIISSALEEICVRGAAGLRLRELWPNLQLAVTSSSLQLSDAVKGVVWGRLVLHPGLRFVASSGPPLESQEVLTRPLEDLERIGLSIVAEEHLRDSFMGLYDLKQSPHFEISQTQRRVLERLALARNNGITQSELAKEFDMKGTNFFYVVRNLECQRLIVRQSTMVREKESVIVENGPKGDHIVNTNLLHLCRYAKDANLNPQQRIEITRSVWPEMLDESGDTEPCSLPIEGSEDCFKEDVSIKNYIPAMKAICEKLEAASNKVGVVSGIKSALGYKKSSGHRAWRSILNRLKYAGLVEELLAKVNGKDVTCLRLLKKFDPKYFQPKAVMNKHNDTGSNNFVKSGRRGQITDQLLELPLENRVYDMIDAEGRKGITILELSKRLGINSKKLYKRVLSMRERFGVVSQSEIHNKTQVYRFWTRNLPHSGTSNSSSDNHNLLLDGNAIPAKLGDLVPYDCSLDSNSKDKPLLLDKTYSCCGPISEVVACHREPEDGAHEANNTEGDVMFDSSRSAPESHVAPSDQSVLISSTSICPTQRYSCRSSTVFAAQREQRILEKLEKEKFLLKVELHKWLEEIEKDKPTTMDRKTLDRSLKRLQDKGVCKCIGVQMPSLSNFNSLRYTEAILHPSVNFSQELVHQIYERQRSFDLQSRQCTGPARFKPIRPVAEVMELTEMKRVSARVDDTAASKAMNVNGFVSAKMVRAKLLHKFLWGYLSSSPYWQNALSSSIKHGDEVIKSAENCPQFSLDAAIKEIPLELFLQVAGSKIVINNLEEKCKLGLRLSDLPVQERRCLMDTQATSRLSSIVKILHRLRLIQLVNSGAVQDVNLLSHALELQPYIEEPMPAVFPCSDVKRSEDCSKLRHDFVLSHKEAVDRYWETLEYCFAAADPASCRQCFPGSTVEEVFHRRSWASVRVMTTQQQMELLKRVTINDQIKKVSFNECLKISRELNLTLEQVLAFSYDKRQARLTSYLKSKSLGKDENANIVGAVTQKRRRLSTDALHGRTRNVTGPGERNAATERVPSDIDEQDMHFDSCSGESISLLQTCRDSKPSDAMVEPQPHVRDSETAAFINQCAFDGLKPSRKSRFSWTDNSDRQLIMQYAKQCAMLGSRFFRVEWPSIRDLPAQADTCKRRMANLKQKSNIRRAILRLCSLLGERYTRFLDGSQIKANKKSLDVHDSGHSDEGAIFHEAVQNESSTCEQPICTSNSQQYFWDDFEDPDLKMALDGVLKYKRLAKLEDAKRVGYAVKKVWTDNSSSGDSNFISHEAEQNNTSSSAGGVLHKNDKKSHKSIAVASTAAQSRSNIYSSNTKFLKFRGKSSISKLCESLSISNAIELLKLVFLSCSKVAGVQTSLATTLQQYSQGDIYAAFSYLREKNYLVIGHGSQPFILSRKFFHYISSSPFPNDSGKKAAKFSSWLQKQQKDLMQDGLAITSDLQCGEIFHLFSLVSSGEISISPSLPEYGVGEVDELKSLDSLYLLGGIGNTDVSKTVKRKIDIQCNSEKVKKHKAQLKADGDRREKGFPGIKVFLNMETVSGVDAFECLGYEKGHALAGNSTLVEGASCLASSLDNVDAPQDIIPQVRLAVYPEETCWDDMARYFTLLLSSSAIKKEPKPSAAVFKSVHSSIYQAGEQGLSMDEISGALNIKGEAVAEIVVSTLEAFQLVIKVNAYNSVRVVDASYTSKYFIGMLGDEKIQNQGYDIQSCTRPQGMSSGAPEENFPEQRDIVDDSQINSRVGLCDGNKSTAFDTSNKTGELHAESQPCGESAVIVEESKTEKAFHVQGNEVGSTINPVAGMRGVFRPILPWINGDGNINTNVYKALTRRILGIVMQNPGILEEDIITKMDVLNPQSCRRLLETMALDKHISVRRMHQISAAASPPTILQSLFPLNFRRPALNLQKHYFANPMSTRML